MQQKIPAGQLADSIPSRVGVQHLLDIASKRQLL